MYYNWFFLTNFMFKQYKNKEFLSVSSTGETLFFLQSGVYSNKESMEKGMTKFSYYIYNKEKNMYYTYVGITKDEKNLEKLKGYFKKLGYDIYIKQVYISNIAFICVLNQYEIVLKETTDNKVIESICSQVLSKYEELILDDQN